jgi:hypothetical protein
MAGNSATVTAANHRRLVRAAQAITVKQDEQRPRCGGRAVFWR